MVLCSCAYSKKIHTKLSSAGYDKNQIVNVLLLSISHSLSPLLPVFSWENSFFLFFFFFPGDQCPKCFAGSPLFNYHLP